MLAVSRPYALAAAALAATSVFAVSPIAPRLVNQLPIRSIETRLVDSSIANIPINLFDDIINIPANELHATQFFTDNLFMAGPWFVVSPTNLWGVDPGDPTHFMSVVNFAVPFPALSGMDSPETDFNAGLGQQLWGFMASELPVNSSCAEASCLPFEPSSPITGMQGVDFYLWVSQVLSGQEKQGLIDNWWTAHYGPNGTFFFDPAANGSTDPTNAVASGHVYGFDGWSSSTGLLGGQGIPGTVGPDNLMPWAGETYTFQPWVPFENFFNSLMADPSTTGLGGTGIDPIYGDPTEIAQTLQAFTAGLMFFDPFTPGSPFCQDACTPITSAHMDYPDLIKEIGNMMPGNPVINEWLADYAGGASAPDGGANVPSEATILSSIALLQNHNFWDFQDAPYVGNNTPGSFDLATLAPEFHQFWTDLGFTVPPLNDPGAYPAAAAAASSSLDPSTLAANMSALTAMFTTSSVSDLLSTLTTDLTTQLQTDLSAMMASIAAELPANIASTLPADLLTMF